MIAYHYPPTRGSSGLQRTLKFSRYLLNHGWQPIILTVHPRAYQQTGNDQLSEVPPEVVVHRAFALDAARHLSIAGRYPSFAALPDRWASWYWGAVPAGLKLIKRYQPDVIWSTYPIATAHKIALTLQRKSGLPWIADCRDSMTEDNYPKDLRTRKTFIDIEKRMVKKARHVVFTTPGTKGMYAARYPEVPKSRWQVIPNGYDEDNFRQASLASEPAQQPGGITLVHSGILYPEERNPSDFFAALSKLKTEGHIQKGGLTVILRATGHDQHYVDMIKRFNIYDIVKLLPPLPYQAALSEMLNTDGLLIFQASTCNHQIPAKAYEYLRAQRPIFSLTDPAGDTAKLLESAGANHIAHLDDKNDIQNKLSHFLAELKKKQIYIPPIEQVQQYSREACTEKLNSLLNTCTD